MSDKLISKTHVRAYILRRQAEIRPGWKFTAVSNLVYRQLDAKVRLWLDRALQRHPSGTKTFKDIV